ncbi:MAG TPA: hypothetical protein DCZ94_10205 [Lentisphaeria bacterium]|nr:MAG: hypothetical protein A2X48_11080 [Lentisphaerae bacterium GWF2_49_21]HBC87316.1 hypothetical protein [Lentisphaeria bacterium]
MINSKLEIRNQKQISNLGICLASFFLLAAFTAISADDAKASGKSSVIVFKNNDLLHGGISSIAASDGKAVWQHQDSKQPFTFNLKNIKEIILDPVEPKTSEAQQTFAVALTNGDTLKGSVMSLDSNILVLRTWYAGDLKIDRRMIREMINSGSSQLIYRGPDNLAGWRVSKPNRDDGDDENAGKVEFKNNTLLLSGYEAYAEKKDIKLPDLVRIDYETTVSNEGSGIILYTDKQIDMKDGSLESEIRRFNAYGVSISKYELSAGRSRNNEWQSAGDSGDDNGKLRKLLNSSPKLKVTIFSNRKAGMINVHVNDTPALKYIDQDKEFPKGSGMCFILTDSSDSRPVEISNIRVGVWDGKLPAPGVADEVIEKDTILFSNKDKTTGVLKLLEKGNLQFETEFAPLTIPLDRVANIITCSANRRQAKRESNDIRAYFSAEDCITINISEITGGKIRGRSENFGEVSLDLGAFEKITFNIYDEETVKDENK